MVIQDLHQLSIYHLNKAFNQAFSDYVLPLRVSVQQLAENIRRDGIDFRFSVGAFHEEQLVGFVLHSLEEWNGVKTAYNGGTGVIPAFRGKKITRQLYDYIVPRLVEAGARQCLLEVIATNQIAVKTYQGIGFGQKRAFTCYKANLKDIPALPGNHVAGIQIREMSAPDWDVVMAFWDYLPSWQYSTPSLLRLAGKVSFLGAFEEDRLVGYAAILRNANRVAQFGVAHTHRGMGIGHGLFHQLAQRATGPLVVINVEDTAVAANKFLKAMGFTCFIKQLEMYKQIA